MSEKSKKNDGPENEAGSVHEMGEISDIGNYKYYQYFGCMLSEPLKYLGTHLLLLFGMLVYYSCAAQYNNWVAILLTVLLHVLVLAIMIRIAFKDPGIILKVHPQYENTEYAQMPLDEKYKSGFMRDVRRSCLIVHKTHSFSLKFCN